MPFIYLAVPLIAACVAQISKFFIPDNRLRFNLRNLLAYSGMPSTHAAVTVSLTTIIALTQSINSPLFAVSLLITFLALRDAMGIRQYIGQQGEVLNELVEELEEDKFVDDDYPRLIEKVGHTPIQLATGIIIGILVAFITYNFWF